MKMNLSILGLILCLCSILALPTATAVSTSNRYFHISQGISKSFTHVDQALDVTADGKIGVAVAFGLITFDLVKASQLQHFVTSPLPSSLKIANTNTGPRVVALTRSGPRTAMIFDLSPSGQLIERARTVLANSPVSFYSPLAVSSASRIGFTIVPTDTPPYTNDLISFSLDDGAILDRLPVGYTGEQLGLAECNNQLTVVFTRELSNLVVVDATNPQNLVERGSISLPPITGFSGVSHADYLFSADCRYLFFLSRFNTIATVDMSNLTVVDFISGDFAFGRLKLFEKGSERLIAAQSAESSTSVSSNALVLFDASNPHDLVLLKQKSIINGFYGFYPNQTDLTFSRSGKQIYVALQDRLRIFEVPTLRLISEELLPSALAPGLGFTHSIMSFGSPGKILGAWDGNLIGIFDTPIDESDFCIQDESSGDVLRINALTGAYQVTRCSNGFTLNGTARVTRRGCLLTIQDFSTDRRVVAQVDSCQNRATASIQIFMSRTTFTMIDLNIINNYCQCPNRN